MKICFASHNRNKLKEIATLLPPHFDLIGLDDLNIHEDIPETGGTFEENSSIKASYVFQKHRIPVFADDSGLLVEALDGQPGVFSARYAGPGSSDDDNMDLLLVNLQGKENRKACFKTVITFIDCPGTEYRFYGEVHGSIIEKRRGEGGFGYDPIFVPEGHDRSFAQFSNEEKNQISHRAKAIQKFLTHLSQLNGQT